MKILLRKWNNEYYVWMNSTYESGKFYVDIANYGKVELSHTDILAVEGDEMQNYVTCAHCGTVIPNTPESIEKHFAEQEAKRDCFKCNSLKITDNHVIDTNFEKDVDGTYRVTKISNSILRCGRTWYNSPPIDSASAKSICTYTQCRASGVTEIKDVFFKYPGLFDKQITADALMKNKYICTENRHDYFEYDLKCRNTIKACVNELGIVDHFIMKSRYSRYHVYYSAKYDLVLFNDGYGRYTTVVPNNVTESKLKQFKDKVSALYKEAKDNE